MLAIAGLAFAESRSDWDRGIQVWLEAAIILLAAILGLVWFAFFSRFPRRIRVWTLASVALAALVLKFALRVDGTTDGRGLPRLAWKWSSRAQALPAAPAIERPSRHPVSPGALADAPQFFGPQRNGMVNGASLARDWAKVPPRELWRQPIGAGWSAFAVAAGRAYTLEQRGEEECVTCYDALSGKLLWSHARRARFQQWQAGEGPHSTPTVDRGRVYAYGATGILDCLDAATGAKVWSRDVLAEISHKNLQWGVSASPLIVDDLVVVSGAQGAGPTLLAYDRHTGQPRWRSGTDSANYSSPILATFAGQPTIVSYNAATFSLHDPATGRELLSRRWGSDSSPKAAQPVAPGGDLLFISAGYGMGCELFHISADAAGKLRAESRWKNVRLKAQFNSIAVRNGLFYGLDDGSLACVDIANGTRRWKGGRYGSGQTLLVDDLIVIQAEKGEVVLAEANPVEFRELGRVAALSSKTWNHPTLAGRCLLVRNDREAVCYELPATTPSGAAPALTTQP